MAIDKEQGPIAGAGHHLAALDQEERDRPRAQPLWRVRLRLWWRSLRTSWILFTENKIGLIGLAIIVFFALLAVAHPILIGWLWDPFVYDPVIGYDPLVTTIHPSPPSARHLLGTDPLGRDVLSQLMYSTTSEFILGMVAALITVALGMDTRQARPARAVMLQEERRTGAGARLPIDPPAVAAPQPHEGRSQHLWYPTMSTWTRTTQRCCAPVARTQQRRPGPPCGAARR